MEFERIGYIMRMSDFRKFEKSQKQLNAIEWAKTAVKKRKSKIMLSAGKSSVDFMLTPKHKKQVINLIEQLINEEEKSNKIQSWTIRTENIKEG